MYINNHLLSGLDKDKFAIITLGFSAQTTANQTQDIIEAKLGIFLLIQFVPLNYKLGGERHADRM